MLNSSKTDQCTFLVPSFLPDFGQREEQLFLFTSLSGHSAGMLGHSFERKSSRKHGSNPAGVSVEVVIRVLSKNRTTLVKMPGFVKQPFVK